MQVKTRIVNCTKERQQYSWVPKYGIMIDAGEAVVIDGDIYTLLMATPRLRRQIEEDESTGRVKITMLTDREMEKISEDTVEKKPEVKPAPPIPRNAAPRQGDMFTVDSDPKTNILGKGMIEMEEGDDGRGKAYDPFTGEEIAEGDMQKPALVNMSDALWKDGQSLEDSIGGGKDIAVLEGPEAPKIYTMKDLVKMSLAKLRKIAADMGMPDVADLKKHDIVKWILETQGNA